jgi:cysteinyl-tRNA synthetase
VAQLRQRLGSLDAAAEPSAEFLAALEDDLNTPIALAWINQLARRAARAEEDEKAAKLGGELLACADLLGLLQMDPQAWVTGRSKVVDLDDEEIERRIQERNEARLAKDFATADRIRDELLTMGITLKDGSEGTTWQATSDD